MAFDVRKSPSVGRAVRRRQHHPVRAQTFGRLRQLNTVQRGHVGYTRNDRHPTPLGGVNDHILYSLPLIIGQGTVLARAAGYDNGRHLFLDIVLGQPPHAVEIER